MESNPISPKAGKQVSAAVARMEAWSRLVRSREDAQSAFQDARQRKNAAKKSLRSTTSFKRLSAVGLNVMLAERGLALRAYQEAKSEFDRAHKRLQLADTRVRVAYDRLLRIKEYRDTAIDGISQMPSATDGKRR